jgi:uncharacterized metal-binding protein YceD (DUF177 family)
MKASRKISVPFTGLKEGWHEFDFEIGSRFFEALDYSEINTGEIHCHVDLNKKEAFLELETSLTGYVNIACDRCLGEYPENIDFSGHLIVKFGEDDLEDSDELMFIKESESEVVLNHYIYESICLSLPVKRVHPDGDEGPSCDPEMLNKLNEHLVDDEKEEETDPRWDKLKDLLKNDKN